MPCSPKTALKLPVHRGCCLPGGVALGWIWFFLFLSQSARTACSALNSVDRRIYFLKLHKPKYYPVAEPSQHQCEHPKLWVPIPGALAVPCQLLLGNGLGFVLVFNFICRARVSNLWLSPCKMTLCQKEREELVLKCKPGNFLQSNTMMNCPSFHGIIAALPPRSHLGIVLLNITWYIFTITTLLLMHN